MDVQRFADANEAQQQDILRACMLLNLTPAGIVDAMRLSLVQWVVRWAARPEPQSAYTDAPLEWHDLDAEELTLLAQLEWWLASTGARPGKGHAIVEVAGVEVEVMLMSSHPYDYYTLTWQLAGDREWTPRAIPLTPKVGYPPPSDPDAWITRELELVNQRGTSS